MWSQCTTLQEMSRIVFYTKYLTFANQMLQAARGMCLISLHTCCYYWRLLKSLSGLYKATEIRMSSYSSPTSVSAPVQAAMLCGVAPGSGLQRVPAIPRLPFCSHSQRQRRSISRRVVSASDEAHSGQPSVQSRFIGFGLALALSALQAASAQAKPAQPDPYQVAISGPPLLSFFECALLSKAECCTVVYRLHRHD